MRILSPLKLCEPRVRAAFPPRRASVMSPLWKAEGSSFSDQFVCCLPLCNRDLMPFSQIVVGGVTQLSAGLRQTWQSGGLEGGAALINYLPTVTPTGALARAKQMKSGTFLGRVASLRRWYFALRRSSGTLRKPRRQSRTVRNSQTQGGVARRKTTRHLVEMLWASSVRRGVALCHVHVSYSVI